MNNTNRSFWGLAEFFKPKWLPGLRIAVSDRDTPTETTPRHSDEELEFWGRIYVDNHLYARGILFATFMQGPQAILESLITSGRVEATEDYLPLLTAQREVAARLNRRRAISRPIEEADLVFLKKQAD